MLGELLNIQPGELKFPFELRKQLSATLLLENVTSEYVAFKIKTTSPKKYCVRPNTGVVAPQSSSEIVVTMQAQKEIPADLQCKDKFLVQSVLMPGGASEMKEVNPDVFNKENGRQIYEAKLRVIYLSPPQPPSPVPESAEEGIGSPTPFSSSNVAELLAPLDPNAKDVTDLRAKLTEARTALASMTEERNTAVKEVQRLRSNLASATADVDAQIARAVSASTKVAKAYGAGSDTATITKSSAGWKLWHVFFLALFVFFIGYFYGKAPTGPVS